MDFPVRHQGSRGQAGFSGLKFRAGHEILGLPAGRHLRRRLQAQVQNIEENPAGGGIGTGVGCGSPPGRMEGIDPHKRRPQGSGPADDLHQIGKIPHAPVGPAPQGIERQVETPGPAALLQPGRRIRLGRRRDQPGAAAFLPAAAPHFQGQIVISQLQIGGQGQPHRDPKPSRDRLALQPPGNFEPPLPPVRRPRFADHLRQHVHCGRGLRPGEPEPHRRPGQSRRRFDELHRRQHGPPGTQTPPGDLPVQALRVLPGHAHGAEQVPVGGLGGAVAAAKIVPVL